MDGAAAQVCFNCLDLPEHSGGRRGLEGPGQTQRYSPGTLHSTLGEQINRKLCQGLPSGNEFNENTVSG